MYRKSRKFSSRLVVATGAAAASRLYVSVRLWDLRKLKPHMDLHQCKHSTHAENAPTPAGRPVPIGVIAPLRGEHQLQNWMKQQLRGQISQRLCKMKACLLYCLAMEAMTVQLSWHCFIVKNLSLSNFEVTWWFQLWISQHQDFTRSSDKTCRIMKWPPGL